MTWTAPPTVVTGDIITAAWGNTHVRDNPNDLQGRLTGTSSNDPIIQPVGVGNGYRLGTSGQKFYVYSVNNATHLGNNLRFDGTDWQLDDTTQPGWTMRLGSSFLVRYAAAGANPATARITSLLDLDNVGKLTGSAVWNSGRFAVAAGATVDTNHAWLPNSLRPAFVLGFYQPGTQSPDANIQQVCGMGPASTEKVRITLVDTLKVRVVSGDSVSNTVVLSAILGPTS